MVLAALLTFIAGIVFMVYYGQDLFPSTTPDTQKKKEIKAEIKPVSDTVQEVRLYFASSDGKGLSSERQNVKGRGIEKLVRETLLKLIEGPRRDDLFKVIPEKTKLVSIKVKASIAYVNLSKEFTDNHPGGSTWEEQTIYSIVNTITLNFPDIKFVQLLVDGKLKKTLAGHVLIGVPLRANKSLILK
ncbi:MAG: GerMN domain-containing protein [Deltaproteobacteria bacterium]|nr:GerMN domain-containing protein [Deltaproteobacteria bacterium]